MGGCAAWQYQLSSSDGAPDQVSDQTKTPRRGLGKSLSFLRSAFVPVRAFGACFADCYVRDRAGIWGAGGGLMDLGAIGRAGARRHGRALSLRYYCGSDTWHCCCMDHSAVVPAVVQ